MRNLAKIEEHESLRKDMNTGAILLSDTNALNEYKSKKAMINGVRNVNEEINTIKEKLNEFEALRSDMKEIKELLRGLVSK